MTKVAVIIPTYNDRERLRLCLDALQQQDYPIADVCVYVVDNNSSQDISSLVKNYSFCRYFLETKAGAYQARNCALKHLADEQYVGFTDADCIPEPNWITTAVAQLNKGEVHALGGCVEVFCENSPPNIFELYEQLFAFPQKVYIENDNFAVTANLFVHRNIINNIGMFNTDLFSGGDAEYGNRIVEAGYKLSFAGDVVVKHPARSSYKQLTSKVKRTVGGCYKQRKTNKVMQRSFSFSQLLFGYLPPVRAIKSLFQKSEVNFSLWTKIQITFLLFGLKYQKNTMKWLYKLGVYKDYERF